MGFIGGLLRLFRKHEAAAVAVTGVAASLVAAVVGISAFAYRAKRAREEAEAQRVVAVAESEISARLAYAGGIVQAARFAEPDFGSNAVDAAGAIRILETSRPDLRGWEHDRLWSSLHAGHRTLRGHVGQVWGVGVSNDGSVLASCGEDGHLVVWDGKNGTEKWRVAAHEGQATGLAMSTDGLLAFTAGADGSVKAWRIGDAEPTWGREAHGGARVMAVAVSADSKRLASVGEDGTVGGFCLLWWCFYKMLGG